jgi:superfamily II DNA/RNA helicase
MDEVNCADGPYAVVLAPTRELAQQIEEEVLKLAKYTEYRCVVGVEWVCTQAGGAVCGCCP